MTTIKHVGVLGMHWGHHKPEEKPMGKSLSSKALVSKNNLAILKTNPYAAVGYHGDPQKVKPELSESEKIRRRNLIIAGVAGITIIAAGALYLKNKDRVDGFIGDVLGKKTGVHVGDPLSSEDKAIFEKLGIKNIKTTQDAIKANMIASWSGLDEQRYDHVPMEKYLNDTKDLVVKKGQVFKRITHQADEVLRDGAYAAFEDDDVNRYSAFLPKLWQTNGKQLGNTSVLTQPYLMSMKSIEDIKSPSFKTRVDIFSELLLKDKAFASDNGFNVGFNVLGREPTVNDAKEHALKFYNTFSNKELVAKGDSYKTYVKEVLNRGYNALVDDNDAGRLTKSPMVLLKASLFEKTDQTALTSSMITAAGNLIKPLGNESLKNTVESLAGKTDLAGKPLVDFANSYMLQ